MNRSCGYCGDEGRLYWNPEEHIFVCVDCHQAGVHQDEGVMEDDYYIPDTKANRILEEWFGEDLW